LRLRPLAFTTFLVWRLRIGACGVGACGFWRYRMPPPPYFFEIAYPGRGMVQNGVQDVSVVVPGGSQQRLHQLVQPDPPRPVRMHAALPDAVPALPQSLQLSRPVLPQQLHPRQHG